MEFASLAAGTAKNAITTAAGALANTVNTKIAGKGMEQEAKNANYIQLLKERLNWLRMPAQYGVGVTDALLRGV